MSYTIKKNAKDSSCVYFDGEILFPLNYEIRDNTPFNFCGHWDLPSGKVSIAIGDYRRAEVTLWKSAPQGFVDGAYGWEVAKDIDAITADDMRDALRAMLPSILALSIPE